MDETPPIKPGSIISRSNDGRLIHAWAVDKTGTAFELTSFPVSAIDRLHGINGNCAAIVLRSGFEIPVALPLDVLEQMVYQPDFKTDSMELLDLREVTGNKAFYALLDGDAAQSGALIPGARMPDGTIYAGVSPDTGRQMFAMPADASLKMTFNKAKDYERKLNKQKACGHDDWHIPTKAELSVLFNNRAAIGGFDTDASSQRDGWYWSSTSNEDGSGTWGQRFSDGSQLCYGGKTYLSSVRCVR